MALIHRSYFLLLALMLFGCGAESVVETHILPRTGAWRMELALLDTVSKRTETLPFLFDLHRNGDAWKVLIHNADETIHMEETSFTGQDFVWKLPYFNTEFKGRVVNDSTLEGHWYNYIKGPDYAIAFTAKAGNRSRFPRSSTTVQMGNQWETHFGPNQEEAAIGLFHQNGDRVTGTFATETGDYRFLDGTLRGDSLYISTFDGSHAFLFKALLKNDTMHGRFWSGIHYQDPFIAVRNPSFKLRHADSLTYLKEGYTMVDLTYTSIDGKVISTRSAEIEKNVLLVQIMGSWCPNCVDESRLLDELYTKYHGIGLNVMALAFEQKPNSEQALAGLKRFRDGLDLHFPIALAGSPNKDSTSVELPFLNGVMSYPTCIFIGRDGMVRRIHTGFCGPGTGAERYAAYKEDLERYIVGLLNEPKMSMASVE